MTVANATIDGFVEISAIPSVFSASTVGASKMLSVSAIVIDKVSTINVIKILCNMKIPLTELPRTFVGTGPTGCPTRGFPLLSLNHSSESSTLICSPFRRSFMGKAFA